MKLAVVQTDPQFGEKEKNIAQAIEMMQSVRADLYVLPELFASGYNFASAEELGSLAEPFRSGKTYDALRQFAAGNNSYVIYGFPEIDGSALFNSAAMIGFDGKEELYRKIHLYDREKIFFQPGNLGFNVFQTPHGRIGMMICFDWYFPESARTLAGKGAQLIAHPSNLVLSRCPDGMPIRCLENGVFAATANRIGTEDREGIRLTYIGQSQITSAKGEILHRAAPDKPGIFMQEIDLSFADNKMINERNHLFNDRRPEYYL